MHLGVVSGSSQLSQRGGDYPTMEERLTAPVESDLLFGVQVGEGGMVAHAITNSAMNLGCDDLGGHGGNVANCGAAATVTADVGKYHVLSSAPEEECQQVEQELIEASTAPAQAITKNMSVFRTGPKKNKWIESLN